jgi:ABC-type glycerol-3-phosphate transport system permease component
MLRRSSTRCWIAVPSTLIPLVLASMAAYAFSWLNFPFRDGLFLLSSRLLMIPVQVAFIRAAKLFRPDRLAQQLRRASGSPTTARSRCRSGSSCCATSSSRCRVT